MSLITSYENAHPLCDTYPYVLNAVHNEGHLSDKDYNYYLKSLQYGCNADREIIGIYSQYCTINEYSMVVPYNLIMIARWTH